MGDRPGFCRWNGPSATAAAVRHPRPTLRATNPVP
jgi:hypothetical protein